MARVESGNTAVLAHCGRFLQSLALPCWCVQLNVYPGLKGLKELLGTVPSWAHYEERERVDVRPQLGRTYCDKHASFAGSCKVVHDHPASFGSKSNHFVFLQNAMKDT